MKAVKNLNFYKDLYLDLFLPDQEEFFTIVHFHGGGLVEGDKGDAHCYAEHLVKLGFAVAVANYGLLTKSRHQEILDDASEAVKYVIQEIANYGHSKGLVISGQSAGAWITLMLCFNDALLKAKNIKKTAICGFISDSSQTTTHFNILKMEQNLDPLLQRIDEAAPLYYVDENTRFSRLLLMTYENDMPNRLEQNKLLYSTIKSFNKEADVELKILSGYHCHGSSELDPDGEYETIKVIKEWMSRL